MAIHWQIPFKSLRAGTNYLVNIYDETYSAATPIRLRGGINTVTTVEDNSDDEFEPIRKHSGNFVVVDDGKDANGNAWNWRSILPNTDTDRPVTITTLQGTLCWCGFMQAQNFGFTLFGGTQEREFPLQCPLTILECFNINYQQVAVKNFAYLLKVITDSIPEICRPTSFVIQGGADAQAWLLKMIDWQNFVSESSGGSSISARFSMYQCLEDMCRFWGWTARIQKKTMYLTMADDTAEPNWLTLTAAQLTTMANGDAAGTTSGTFTDIAPTGNIFASTNNDDYQQRGPSKALVTADANPGSADLLFFAPDSVVKQMEQLGWQGSEAYGDKYVTFTNDLASFNTPLQQGQSTSNYGLYNLVRRMESLQDTDGEVSAVLRIKQQKTSDPPAISLNSIYQHCFNTGYFRIRGNVYRGADRLDAVSERNKALGIKAGDKYTFVRLGIGESRENAMWYNGNQWTSVQSYFKVTIGNTDDILYAVSQSGNFTRGIIPVDNLYGSIFFDIEGDSNLDNIDGVAKFEIADFKLEFERTNQVVHHSPIDKSSRVEQQKYEDSNTNHVRDEFAADCIFASDNNMVFGYGVIINPDGSYMQTVPYGSAMARPEQHLATRVVNFWQNSRRRLQLDLRADIASIEAISPQHHLTIDGTYLYPISISRNWADDVVNVILLEMDE